MIIIVNDLVNRKDCFAGTETWDDLIRTAAEPNFKM